MSFFGLWSDGSAAAASSTAATSVQRRFDLATADLAALMRTEIGGEWEALHAHFAVLSAAALKFCNFFAEDQSMMPALRDDKSHFAAHHMDASDGSGGGCGHCAQVSGLVREFHLSIVELSTRIMALSSSAELALRRRSTGGQQAYTELSAMPLIEEFASYALAVHRNVRAVRARLLSVPEDGVTVDALFQSVCALIRAMCSDTDALFADRIAELDNRAATNL